MDHDIVSGIAYGGDYNPEQWPEEVWAEDMRLMRQAGVNLVSIGIFSWVKLQPSEDQFTWDWMDRLMDLLHENCIRADLATATAAPPAWLSVSDPAMMAVDAKGHRYTWGSRQSYCPNSRTYRKAAATMARAMAERYADHPALAMWHVNNEYACHIRECCCDTCAGDFRGWLKKKYSDLETLNIAWGTAFWSQDYNDWNHIMPPRLTGAQSNPGQALDYKRFMSESILALFTMERDILKSITPELKITTNFMGQLDVLDYWKWSAEIDIISWDSYPDPHDGQNWQLNAFYHDMMKSFAGGRPFMLMEQAAGRVNWRKENGMKHPGLMRFHSMQALAHGADAVMFFQWRQSRRGAEQFHSAMLSHAGEKARTFRDVAEFGRELGDYSDLSGSGTEAEVGIMLDYESWWTSEFITSPTVTRPYPEDLLSWHRALLGMNVPVCFVGPEGSLKELKFLILPRTFMISKDTAGRIAAWVEAGGVLLTGHGTGWVDEECAVYPGGVPGPLTDLLGLTVADVDPLPTDRVFGITTVSGDQIVGTAWREELILKDSEVTDRYSGGSMDGWPAGSRRQTGAGAAFYISYLPVDASMDKVLEPLLDLAGVNRLLKTPDGVYATERIDEDGGRWLFLLNSTNEDRTVEIPGSGEVVLGPLDGTVRKLQ